MAFSKGGLSALQYTNGFTFWHYWTEDLMYDVGRAGYFNPANKMIREGDIILVCSKHISAPVPVFFGVTDILKGDVITAPMTGGNP